eukprot:symbB.v1.2.036292.t1/scaffold5085.1/size31119/3
MFAAGFPECPLRSELQNFASETSGQAAVVLEVLFPDTYPMQPPFIRIVRPRFQMHTGHITVGGSICMQLLTPSGWLPTVSLENVFVAIRSEMVEGGGRLDLTCKRDYSVQEAREAFQRVAHRYGWLRLTLEVEDCHFLGVEIWVRSVRIDVTGSMGYRRFDI